MKILRTSKRMIAATISIAALSTALALNIAAAGELAIPLYEKTAFLNQAKLVNHERTNGHDWVAASSTSMDLSQFSVAADHADVKNLEMITYQVPKESVIKMSDLSDSKIEWASNWTATSEIQSSSNVSWATAAKYDQGVLFHQRDIPNGDVSNAFDTNLGWIKKVDLKPHLGKPLLLNSGANSLAVEGILYADLKPHLQPAYAINQ